MLVTGGKGSEMGGVGRGREGGRGGRLVEQIGWEEREVGSG